MSVVEKADWVVLHSLEAGEWVFTECSFHVDECGRLYMYDKHGKCCAAYNTWVRIRRKA